MPKNRRPVTTTQRDRDVLPAELDPRPLPPELDRSPAGAALAKRLHLLMAAAMCAEAAGKDVALSLAAPSSAEILRRIPGTLEKTTATLRVMLGLVEDAVEECQSDLDQLEESAGLVDPESGRRFDGDGRGL